MYIKFLMKNYRLYGRKGKTKKVEFMKQNFTRLASVQIGITFLCIYPLGA